MAENPGLPENYEEYISEVEMSEALMEKERRVLYWESNHKLPTTKQLERFSLQNAIDQDRFEVIL